MVRPTLTWSARARAAVLAGAVSVMCGCTGVEPAIVGAGASAAETGVTIVTKGKLVRFEPARYEDVLAALRTAAATLKFTFREDELEPRRARLIYKDDRTGSIVAVVEWRTEHITMVQADVGTFGYAGLGGLLLSETNAELVRRNALITAVPSAAAPAK